jgi:glycosyltransferase involved in cell wall biosynthesis
LRVVQLLPELNEGGVERGVVELNREFVKRGVESIIISAGGKQTPQIDADGGRHITFDVCSKNPLTAIPRVMQLRTLFRDLKPDIVHARSRVPAWLTYLANKKLGIPFVTTVHGFNSVNAYSRVMTYGDRVICVSQAIKQYIQAHYAVPDEKLTVIPRGVDLDVFDPGKIDRDFVSNFKKQYDLEGKFVVTSVGRITQLKDYETFIRAVAVAKAKKSNIVGLIVGGAREDKQEHLRELQNLVSSLGLTESVYFTGSQKKIAEVYSLSDLIVSCSKKPESFGRSAAEALAMGTPVIATNHGGIVDVVRPGKTGQLFAVGDATMLAKLMKTIPSDSLVGLRQFVEVEFSLLKMVERTLAVYQPLFRGKGQ